MQYYLLKSKRLHMLKLTTDFTFAPWQNAIEEYMNDIL